MAVDYFQRKSSKGHKRESLNTSQCPQGSGSLAKDSRQHAQSPREIFTDFSSLHPSLSSYAPASLLFSSPSLLFSFCFLNAFTNFVRRIGGGCPEDKNGLSKTLPYPTYLAQSHWTSLQQIFIKENVHFFHYCHRQKRKDPVSLAICPWRVSHLWSQSGISF